MSKNICQHSKQAVVALKANLMTNPSLKTTKRLELELKIQQKKKHKPALKTNSKQNPEDKNNEIIENNSGHKRQFHDKPIIEKPQKDSKKAHPRRQKRVVIVVGYERRPWGPIMVATQW